MEHKRPLQSLSDDELLRRLSDLTQQSRRLESELVAHIGEVDERKLYAREASPSMFAYCIEVLHLSEAEAYLRITTARAAREHPMLLAMLGDGRLHLTGIAKLAPHLTRENRDAILKRATHRSKRQIEELIAEIAPRPDVPTAMRKLPEARIPPTPAAPTWAGPGYWNSVRTESAPRRPLRRCEPAVIQALSPARYKVQFTVGAELHEKLERLQALMRAEVSDGDLATIIERAVTEKLERLEARRYARTKRPRKRLAETDTSPSSRHIPAAVRRVVHERDGNQCRYVDKRGRRCSARDRLELHHRHPFGVGGDHGPANICLMCRTHNQYLAERDYGKAHMTRGRDQERVGIPPSPRRPADSLRTG